MFKKILLFSIFVFTLIPEISLGADIACPTYQPSTLTSDAVIAKIDECREARTNGSANGIEDFACPSGNYTWENNQTITPETLAYYITTNLLMNELDAEVRRYMETLQKSRDKDAVSWTENIRTCLRGNGPNNESESLADKYHHICDFITVQDFLNKNNSDRIMIGTTDTYPQILCRQFANKKIAAWESLGHNLMQDGINKSLQNDRDYYIDALSGKYVQLLDLFHLWQRIVTRASEKIKVYIKNPVT